MKDFLYLCKQNYSSMIPQIINQKVWLYDTTYGDWQTAKSVGRLIWKTDKTDYRKYATVEEYKKAYKQEDNPSTNGSYLNALYSIFSPMHKGDIIIAREGLHDIVAWGEVMSDYMYDKENADYQSYRDVRWHFLGNIPVELKEKGVWFYEISADIYEPLFEKNRISL